VDPLPFRDPSWCHALTLTERLAPLRGARRTRPDAGVDKDLGRRRLQRWRSQVPFTTGAFFAQRLALDGLSEEDLCDLLGEPIEAVHERAATPPGWLAELARAFSGPSCSEPFPLPEALEGQEMAGFLDAIEPPLSRCRGRLHEGVRALTQGRADLPFDPRTIEGVLYANLPERLLMMLSPTMALELQVARWQGALEGGTPRERFRSFLGLTRRRAWALALLREYPVLARQVIGYLENSTDFLLEFLGNLCADWETLRARFSPGEDPGPIVRVDGGLGDVHRRGRSVLILRFRSGLQVVYKPKPLAVDVHFQELLAWLNGRGNHPPFRMLNILDRGTFGWEEFVAARGCTSADEVRRFYFRQGGLLALLYALEATDFHFENLIAAGEHPVLIDLEALFHPRVERADDTQADLLAGSTMARSVLRVGLLPQVQWPSGDSEGIDLSGLGAEAGQLSPRPVPQWEGAGTDAMRLTRKRVAMPQGRHRPSLLGTEVNALDHAEEVLTGFTSIYRLLLEHRDDLLSAEGPLARFAEDEVRVLLRPTQTYASLLRESFHPDLLRDALDRDRFFDRLWIDVKRRPELVRVLPAERDDLNRGDIPKFTTRPGARDVWSGAGARIPEYFDEPGMALVRRRLHRLGDEDLMQQLWFIRASLATLSRDTDRATRPTSRPTPPRTTVDRERLLAASRAVGDRLEALAWRSGQEATWIGLMASLNERRWLLLPLGVDLYDGLSGVVLFLAYLGAITREARYTTLAQAALTTLRRQVERSRSVLTAIGGFKGWGGMIYTYAHLAVLWGQPALLEEAEAVAEWLPPLIERDEHRDLIGGAAGCIGGLLSLDRCSPSAQTRAVAIQCGDRLLACAQAMERGIGWVTSIPASRPLTGFAHGAAGMAWALGELAALTGAERFRKASHAALAYERSLFSAEARNWPDLRKREELGLPGSNGQAQFMAAWCHGAPGIGLARLQCLRRAEEGATRAEIDAALRTTLDQGFGDNHSLCHGDLGNLELLLEASEMLDEPCWRAEVGRMAALILESIHHRGWLCGVPSGVETPGLMIGLAGIGYGLLRLAEPSRVPSVLVLAPPGATPPGTRARATP